jgi:uncharacterized RDD family membrane protein YckC
VAPSFEFVPTEGESGSVIATPGRRFKELLLEIVLAVVTLGIGWLIWFAVIAKDGQTPAKRILKLKVVNQNTTDTVTTGVMWARTLLVGLVLSIAASIIDGGAEGKANDFVGLLSLVDALFIFSVTRQRLIDRLLKTQVIDLR